MDPAGNASNSTVAFEQAASRENISTGEKMAGLFGKIAKWFADLKNHSFSDLIQNATTADSTRAVSAAVAKNLQDQITAQNTKNIYTPFCVSQWLNGSEQFNVVVDIYDSIKSRIPIIIGGNVGSQNFLMQGMIENLTDNLNPIKAENIYGAPNIGINANIHLKNQQQVRINIVGASGMGQHVYILFPIHGVKFVQKW